MLLTNKNFYPTPKALIKKMLDKLSSFWGDLNFILEPSAGRGDIIEYIISDRHSNLEIYAIEKDPDLHSLLLGKVKLNVNVIDYDFLTYSGQDKFDLIIANPPFDEGDKHLLKAIEIMYSGHIVFLLNAETIKNPYSNTRKLLVQKLEELNADVTYIEDAFKDADRKTHVEVALVHIQIKRYVEDDLFDGMETCSTETNETVESSKELASKESLSELVFEYNRSIEVGTKTVVDFYKNYTKISDYLVLNTTNDKTPRYETNYKNDNSENLTALMKRTLNSMIVSVRKDFWNRALDLKCISDRLTVEKKDQFHQQLLKNEDVDFTEQNVLTFITKLISTYEDTLNVGVDKIFDMFTQNYAWDKELHTKNTHYFNGWSTNNAFMVNTKVIIPFYSRLWSYTLGDNVDYRTRDELNDIDKVMSYFDGGSDYVSIVDAIEKSDNSKNIESTYFYITWYKKGTVHLTFKDENIRRRFNVTACRNRSWLPNSYGNTPYEDLNTKEKLVVESFEGKKSYVSNVLPGKTLYSKKNLKQLPFYTDLTYDN